MKDINSLVGKTVELTQRVAEQIPDKSYTKKDGYAERTFKATITDVEDRDEYYYVSYRPVEYSRCGRFGCFRVYKNAARKYGVVAINGVELY